jgi:hypothetical protein
VLTQAFLEHVLAASVPLIAVHDDERWNCAGATLAVDLASRQHSSHATRVGGLIVLAASRPTLSYLKDP